MYVELIRFVVWKSKRYWLDENTAIYYLAWSTTWEKHLTIKFFDGIQSISFTLQKYAGLPKNLTLNKSYEYFYTIAVQLSGSGQSKHKSLQ